MLQLVLSITCRHAVISAIKCKMPILHVILQFQSKCYLKFVRTVKKPNLPGQIGTEIHRTTTDDYTHNTRPKHLLTSYKQCCSNLSREYKIPCKSKFLTPNFIKLAMVNEGTSILRIIIKKYCVCRLTRIWQPKTKMQEVQETGLHLASTFDEIMRRLSST